TMRASALLFALFASQRILPCLYSPVAASGAFEYRLGTSWYTESAAVVFPSPSYVSPMYRSARGASSDVGYASSSRWKPLRAVRYAPLRSWSFAVMKSVDGPGRPGAARCVVSAAPLPPAGGCAAGGADTGAAP